MPEREKELCAQHFSWSHAPGALLALAVELFLAGALLWGAFAGGGLWFWIALGFALLILALQVAALRTRRLHNRFWVFQERVVQDLATRGHIERSEIAITQIGKIRVQQPFYKDFLDIGDLLVLPASRRSPEVVFHNVARPRKVKRMILTQKAHLLRSGPANGNNGKSDVREL